MPQFFNYSFMLLLCLFSLQSNAKTLSLAPNESKMLSNNAPWALNATCNIQSDHLKSGKIRVVVLKNQGKINGRNLSAGQGTSFTVRNNSHISVSADSGTQINLINLSSDTLEAVCCL